ncbi:MAG TPA: alpha/beta hydrolase [Ilumatobacter sp.]|nr:alpha/beta hydrolase [Ilumatobacter sp.]
MGVPYDEFGLFHENAAEFGLPFDGPPVVRRETVEVEPSRSLSALVWGDAEPQLFFLHGGAQNAHTYDTVALALQRPLVCVDLPAHGHSDGGAAVDGLTPQGIARDVAVVCEALAPQAAVVVGMSLGGLSAIMLAEQSPHLVRRLVLVDVTPGVNGDKAKAIHDFVRGPATFPDFEALLARTVEFNPTRSESSLRRGILHNALQLADGSWVWRHQRNQLRGDDLLSADPADTTSTADEDEFRRASDHAELWEVVGRLAMPVLLVRGMRTGSVVDDDDVAEFRKRCPHVEVLEVDAGHSVQGDQPLQLAAAIETFMHTPTATS